MQTTASAWLVAGTLRAVTCTRSCLSSSDWLLRWNIDAKRGGRSGGLALNVLAQRYSHGGEVTREDRRTVPVLVPYRGAGPRQARPANRATAKQNSPLSCHSVLPPPRHSSRFHVISVNLTFASLLLDTRSPRPTTRFLLPHTLASAHLINY
jgi:hypothetical protein